MNTTNLKPKMNAIRYKYESIPINSSKINDLIVKVINQRSLLIKQGKGNISTKVVKSLGILIERIQQNQNRNEYQQARFLLRNWNYIVDILPGQSSKCHLAIIIELDSCLKHAQQIIKTNTIQKYV
jgi:hypothetical protein